MGELTALSAAKQRLECWPLLRPEGARRHCPNKRPGVRSGEFPSGARRPGRTPSLPSLPSLHLGARVPHREAQEKPGSKRQTHNTVPQRPEVHAHGLPFAITPEPPSAPPLVHRQPISAVGPAFPTAFPLWPRTPRSSKPRPGTAERLRYL